MTTTNTVAKSNQEANPAVVAAAAEKRVRRSPSEAREARITRESDLAAKADARAKRFEEQAAKAKERAAKAMQRKEDIANQTVTTRERQEMPIIAESVQKRAQRDIKQALKDIGAKHNLDFSDVTPRVTQRGSALSLRITAHVAGIVKSARKAIGASREAVRFMEHHKLVGIKPSLLGREVQLAGETGTFKLLGLRGRSHEVVLQQVGGKEEVRTMPADDFKTRMVAA
jgi:hypothetical protein